MVKTYHVKVTCRIDPMQNEQSIDQELNTSLRMFKAFYKGKKSVITKSSDIIREYTFDDLTMVNSRRLKSVAERNKKSIQLKGVLIKESGVEKENNDVSDEEDSSYGDDKNKKTDSGGEEDSDSDSDPSGSEPEEKEGDSDSSNSSKSSTSSSGSDSSKSSKPSKPSNSSKSSSSDSDSSDSSNSSSSDSDPSNDLKDSVESPTGLPFGKKNTSYKTLYNPPDMSFQVNDPYLDNFVPSLHALAPTNFSMGVNTDPSVMALSMLASSKNNKDFGKAKKLLNELQTLIMDSIVQSNADGDDPNVLHEKHGLLTLRWLQSPSVTEQLDDMGINQGVNTGLPQSVLDSYQRVLDSGREAKRIQDEAQASNNRVNNQSWFRGMRGSASGSTATREAAASAEDRMGNVNIQVKTEPVIEPSVATRMTGRRRDQ